MKKQIKKLVYTLSKKRDTLYHKWSRSKYFDGYLDATSEVIHKLEKILLPYK